MARRSGVLRLWHLLPAGAVFTAVAVHDWLRFTGMEHGDGGIWVSRRTRLLYEMGGKSLVIAVPASLAFLLFLTFVVLYWRGRDADRRAAKEAADAAKAAEAKAAAAEALRAEVRRGRVPMASSTAQGTGPRARTAIDMLVPSAPPSHMPINAALLHAALTPSEPPPADRPVAQGSMPALRAAPLTEPPRYEPLPEGAEPKLLSDRAPPRPRGRSSSS